MRVLCNRELSKLFMVKRNNNEKKSESSCSKYQAHGLAV